ncbi:hypothetical protein D6X30_RS35350 [Escherichia coli]|nr:hypothetical protein [Escherichia coli]EEU2101829.1 hypothetical protein [Escherichia coli]
MSQKNFVELRNVTKRFGSNTVIDNINLTIPQGQMATSLNDSAVIRLSTISISPSHKGKW